MVENPYFRVTSPYVWTSLRPDVVSDGNVVTSGGTCTLRGNSSFFS